MATVQDLANAAEKRLLAWTNGYPRPPAGQGVRADAMLRALRALEPIAKRIAGLPDGAAKGGFPGAGYLTGPTITADDKATAGRVLYEINTRLPSLGAAPIEPWLLNQIKASSQRLLMIATDLDVSDQWRTLLDVVPQALSALRESFVELPRTLGTAAAALARGAGQAAGQAASGFFGGLRLDGTTIALGLGAAAVLGVLLLRR